MLPIGSVGIAMRAILSASRPLSNGRRVWVGSADHWMVECVLHRLASTGGERTSSAASAAGPAPKDRPPGRPNTPPPHPPATTAEGQPRTPPPPQKGRKRPHHTPRRL